MYDFIFIVYYKLFSLTKNEHADPKDAAINFMTVVIFFHLFFVQAAFSFVTEVNLAFAKGYNKYYSLPFILVFMYIIYRIYKKRFNKVVLRYNEQNVLTIKNIILVVVVLTLCPLLFGIFFLNNK